MSSYSTPVRIEQFERYPVDENSNIALFKGEQLLEIKHQYNIDVEDFTYSFDLIILNEAFKDSKECKLFQKGEDTIDRDDVDERSPKLTYNSVNN